MRALIRLSMVASPPHTPRDRNQMSLSPLLSDGSLCVSRKEKEQHRVRKEATTYLKIRV